jgi:hypothetical protein
LPNHHNGHHERRAGVRISPKGTLILSVGEHAQRARLANIGAHGCLATTHVTAPEKLLGHQVDIELRLDGPDATWLRLSGHVVRIEATAVALAFDTVPDEFVRLIDEMLTASHHHRRILSVMLVDATPLRRRAMAEAFRAVGCVVVGVATPLEAIVRLGESHFEPRLVAVADSLPTSTSDDLRRFIEKAHPDAKLVTIGDELLNPLGLGNWLSSANPDGDLAARIRDVLMRPMQQP